MALGAVTRRALVLAWILASFAVVGEASAQETPHASIQWEGVEGDWLDTQAICDRVLSRTGVTLDVEPETRALLVRMTDRGQIEISLDGPDGAHLERTALLPEDRTAAGTAADPATETPADAGTRVPLDLRVGAALHLGSVPSGTGTEVDLLYGFEASWAPPELIAIGAREVAVNGLPRGAGVRLDAAPFFELRYTVSFFTVSGQLGAHLQVIFETDTGQQRFGIAPMVVLGARFRLAPAFSIGIETALRVVATGQFTTGLHDLPQLAVPWTGGPAAIFHL